MTVGDILKTAPSPSAQSGGQTEDGRTETPLTPTTALSTSLDALPALTLVATAGLLVIAIAGNAARMGQAWAEPVFWLGLAVFGLPLVWRLLGPGASDAERLGLVLVFGIGLYAVKLLHSPFEFTFPDEFVHLDNTRQTLQTHALFQPNPIVPVSALYPGLASASTALISLSRLSDFAAGVLLIGAARLVLLLVMFLVVARVAGSARLAGITAAIYATNPNFVFYSAEYGYEPFALSFAGVVMLAVVQRWFAPNPSERRAWTVVGLTSVLALVITHHVTTYALVGVALGLCVLIGFILKQPRRAPWDVAIVGLVAALGWLLLIAPPTLVYLGQILGGALSAAVQVVMTHQLGRQPFQSTVSGAVTPLAYQILGLASAALIAIALPFGLWQVWRNHRGNVFVLLLGLGGLLFPPVQLLRLTQFGWETAIRSSEFLFVGVGFLLALVLVSLQARVSSRFSRLLSSALTLYVAVIFAGGLVVGWRADLLLPRAFLVSGGGPPVEPEGMTDARWTLTTLGAGNRFAADASTASYLATFGNQYALTGDAGGVRSALLGTSLDDSVRYIIDQNHLRFVALDRRAISWNSIVGIYPPRPGVDPDQANLIDPAAIAKFDEQPGVSRILDSGNIVIFDVTGLNGPLPNN